LEQAKWRARQSAEWKAFHTAVRYATRDDQSHPLRDAILKYIELPPILPQPGPDEKLETDLTIMGSRLASRASDMFFGLTLPIGNPRLC